MTYSARVEYYENQGMTRSDAQGVVDCEIMQGKFEPEFDPEYPMDSVLSSYLPR